MPPRFYDDCSRIWILLSARRLFVEKLRNLGRRAGVGAVDVFVLGVYLPDVCNRKTFNNGFTFGCILNPEKVHLIKWLCQVPNQRNVKLG